MTREELAKAIRANQEEMQNNFIDKLTSEVEYLLEKANKADYIPTDHEREQFGKIATIVANMNNWF